MDPSELKNQNQNIEKVLSIKEIPLRILQK